MPEVGNLPPWVATARGYLGTAEIPGPEHNPTIQQWLIGLRAWWRDDETPWCGAFVARCLQEHEIELPKHWYRARAWLDWGAPLAAPALGAIAVFERGPHTGHVNFIVGRDARGALHGLGGNQGNRVSIAPFAASRVLGYRWPRAHPLLDLYTTLPVYGSADRLSASEA